MTSPTSFALFLCGTPPDTLRKDPEYDGYDKVFSRFFQSTLPINATFKLDAYDVVEKREYPTSHKLDSYDAIVLTGSGGCFVLL